MPEMLSWSRRSLHHRRVEETFSRSYAVHKELLLELATAWVQVPALLPAVVVEAVDWLPASVTVPLPSRRTFSAERITATCSS